jgi:hypothetical protein
MRIASKEYHKRKIIKPFVLINIFWWVQAAVNMPRYLHAQPHVLNTQIGFSFCLQVLFCSMIAIFSIAKCISSGRKMMRAWTADFPCGGIRYEISFEDEIIIRRFDAENTSETRSSLIKRVIRGKQFLFLEFVSKQILIIPIDVINETELKTIKTKYLTKYQPFPPPSNGN